MPETLII